MAHIKGKYDVIGKIQSSTRNNALYMYYWIIRKHSHTKFSPMARNNSKPTNTIDYKSLFQSLQNIYDFNQLKRSQRE